MTTATIDLRDAPARDDGPLLPLLAAGDGSAMERAVRRYGPLIRALARRHSPTTDDAEDAVQEVFLKLWRNADRFDESRASEMTFVAMLANRCLIDQQRRRSRRLQPEMLEAAESIAEEVDRDHDPVAEREQVERVRALFSRLSPDRRKILEMRYDLGLAHEAIAERLRMPIGTVKSQVRRGLIRIRSVLGEAQPCPS